jgi:ASC-1-like (ASCH) protein
MEHRVHYLKTINPYFNDVDIGVKTFEVRKNDRDFKTGDIMILDEYDPITNEFSGGRIKCIITYVLDDETYCKKSYVVLGFAKLK